jgi:hypothetical protein
VVNTGRINLGILRMIRAGAAQHYKIRQATWGFSNDKNYGVQVLRFEINTEPQPSTFPGEDRWQHEPWWKLAVWLPNVTEDLLRPECKFNIPKCYDEFTGVFFASFHYDEWEGTEPNQILVHEISGDMVRMSIEGYINDPVASMSATKIIVNADFQRLSPHPAIGFGQYRENLPPHEPPIGAKYYPPGIR